MNRTLALGLAAALVAVVAVLTVTPLQATVLSTLGIQQAPLDSVLAPVESLIATPTPVPPTETPTPAATPTPLPTATPMPTPTPRQAVSYLDEATLVTIYGRAFGVAPILGRLGSSNSFDDVVADMAQFTPKIASMNDGKKVLPAVHLIYGMAIPCPPNDDCLLYLEGTDPEVVKHYIEPAAARGWQVILDTQLGRSDPVTQVQRMIDKGYLNYDNVQVAIDPEFQSVPGHDIPGTPIGTVEASEINAAQKLIDEHVKKVGLPHKKILIVHQFGDANIDDGVPFMIQNKDSLQTFQNVDLVIDADGYGHPDSKATKYNRMTDTSVYPFVQWRGIKLFLPNPYEQTGHYDQPQMTFEMVFGLSATPGDHRMATKPNVIIIC